MSVQFFVPASLNSSEIGSVLEAAVSAKPIAPFDSVLVSFVTDFAKSILLDNDARNYPELIVLANFFKAANIAKLQTELDRKGSTIYAGRGLVFHLAPSNVDSVFLYSSLISILCGNVNIIRISGNAGEQVQFILNKINNLISRGRAEIGERFIIMTYPHDDAITSVISKYCHLRVVWGGDATVNKIRSLPLRPTAGEICFPDRFSSAMFCSEAINKLDQVALDDLCSKFFNDSIWFSQQACSSPRLVCWIGDDDSSRLARVRFWEAFKLLLQQKTFENSAGMVMERFVAACMCATHSLHNETTSIDFPSRILLGRGPLATLKNYHCGNGLFFEQTFSSISDFYETLSDREQTLATFGFEKTELEESLRNLPMRSLDRITGIGHALDFSHVWDGYNLLNAFTRCISVNI